MSRQVDRYGVAIVQNVTPNHHHAVYIDGFARRLKNTHFRPTVILQNTTEPLQFADMPYDLHLISGKYRSVIGQMQFTQSLWPALNRIENCLIIHTMNPFAPLVISLLWRRFRFKQPRPKIIYDVRGLWVEIGTHLRYFPPWTGRFINALDVGLAKQADLVIAISDRLRQRMIAKGIPADHITVVPGGCDIEEFRSAEPFSYKDEWGWNGKVIGYVSSIGKGRHSDTVIRAFKSVADHLDSPVYLAMIGPIAQPEYFHWLVADLGLENRVKLPGFIPHYLIASMIKGFDIAVSIFPPQRYDFQNVSLPYKVLEYLGAGVPILACNNECHTSILTHLQDAYIVEPDQQSIANGMLTLIQNPELRKRLSKGAQATSPKYSFEHITRLLEDIYHKLLN